MELQILFHYLFLHLQCILIENYMDIKSLLSEIELNVKELKYLVASFSAVQDDLELKDVLLRKIKTTQQRLDEMQSFIIEENHVISESKDAPIIIKNDVCVEAVDTEPITQEPETIADAIDNKIIETELETEETVEDEIESAAEEEGEELIEELVDETETETKLETPALNTEKVNESTAVIGERVYTSGDLRKSISLNDSFRFLRDIFDGDSELMNKTLDQISAKIGRASCRERVYALV